MRGRHPHAFAREGGRAVAAALRQQTKFTTRWADNGQTVLYLEGDVVRAELTNAHKIDVRRLAEYERDWTTRGSWPLAASHFPNRRST